MTINREKVIKALECCTSINGCYDCPYGNNRRGTDHCQLNSTRDALILLREQEPVRCRNCRHYNTECFADGCGWCDRHDFGTNDEWYCADGEGK